jgi:uncharacterized repeat protein (TIGR01451 family)
MRLARSTDVMHPVTPRLWRMLVVALCTLILCSCRGPQNDTALQQAGRVVPPGHASHAVAGTAPMPGVDAPARPQPDGAVQTAFLQPPAQSPSDQDSAAPMAEPPRPYEPVGAWAPPAVAGPWPEHEYLADGGDAGSPAGVRVRRDGQNVQKQVVGVEMEDTVAHYDAPDGRTLLTPSNRVNIYSPRFRSVRQVVNLVETEQADGSLSIQKDQLAATDGRVQSLARHKQSVRAAGGAGQRSLTTFRTREGERQMSIATGPRTFQDRFLPFENLFAIRHGRADQAEMGWLTRGTQSAVTWEHALGLQVVIDGKAATAVVRNERVESLYTIEEPPARPQLRIFKVASTQLANPGDTIDFTIRFDNIGNQTLSNVTIIDNLAPRLEFVEGSQQSSVETQFSTQVNEGESLVLKWQVVDPLQPGKDGKPGDGGIVRFRCIVR